MIDAKDLRIGNAIKKTYTGEVVVVDIDVLKIMSYHFYDGCFEGIGLTPEILEAAGFEESVDRFRLPFGEGEYSERWDLIWLEGKGLFMEVNQEFTMPVNIATVHQLQNFYHALTGEELTINLPVAV